MDIKHKVLELFIENKRLRFSDIEKGVGVRSNTLAYHLDAMIKAGILTKDEDDYLLTNEGEKMVPFFAHITQKEAGVLPVVIAAIIKDNQILLLKRKKKPHRGYWALPGGKLKLEESIPDSIVREVKEATGLDSEFSHFAGVIHERVKENDDYKNAFVIFLAVVNPTSDKLKAGEEGEVEWFPLDNLQHDRIIPADYVMIKEYLKETSKVNSIVMEEKEEKLVSFKQTKF